VGLVVTHYEELSMQSGDSQSRDQVEQRIAEKAASDPDFRQQLINDPRATLGAELGVSLPENVNVTVLEESTSNVYIVLPPAGTAAGTELSDEELGAVAGGSGNSWNDTTCVNAGCW
jgi:hypothetical protein